MISGMFSIVYQGMVTRIMPLFKVDYTSYRPAHSRSTSASTNWFLLALRPGGDGHLPEVQQPGRRLRPGGHRHHDPDRGHDDLDLLPSAQQHGQSARSPCWSRWWISPFSSPTSPSCPHGGYWSLVIAAIPLAVILIYTAGQKRLYQAMQPMHLEMFLEIYWQHYKGMQPIPGSALFFARDMRHGAALPGATMFANHIIYEDNIIVSITQLEEPYGASAHFRECYAGGMRHFEIMLGYMEVVDIGRLLQEAGIRYRAIFYGVEEISTSNPIWQIFSLIKRLTPSYVHFYKLPPDRMHGVTTRVEM